MTYTPKQVADGLALFIEGEMLPALSGWKVWAGAAALALASRNAETLIDTAVSSPAASTLGLVGKDGLIDADAASEAIKAAIRKHGKFPVSIPLLDTEFCFNEPNVDTLLDCIKRAAGDES